MWLEESGVIVEIVARAKEADDAAAAGDENFGFDKSDLRARVIMISEYLKVTVRRSISNHLFPLYLMHFHCLYIQKKTG